MKPTEIVKQQIKMKKRIDMRPYCGVQDCEGDGCGNPGKMLANCKSSGICFCVVCSKNFGCVPISKAFMDVSRLKE